MWEEKSGCGIMSDNNKRGQKERSDCGDRRLSIRITFVWLMYGFSDTDIDCILKCRWICISSKFLSANCYLYLLIYGPVIIIYSLDSSPLTIWVAVTLCGGKTSLCKIFL